MSNKFYDTVEERCKNFLTMSENDLREFFTLIYPGGSGPLSAMSIAASAILATATLRGFDTTDWHRKK